MTCPVWLQTATTYEEKKEDVVMIKAEGGRSDSSGRGGRERDRENRKGTERLGTAHNNTRKAKKNKVMKEEK